MFLPAKNFDDFFSDHSGSHYGKKKTTSLIFIKLLSDNNIIYGLYSLHCTFAYFNHNHNNNVITHLIFMMILKLCLHLYYFIEIYLCNLIQVIVLQKCSPILRSLFLVFPKCVFTKGQGKLDPYCQEHSKARKTLFIGGVPFLHLPADTVGRGISGTLGLGLLEIRS